jgi:cytochrome c oxidase cbb3-type subunit I/II
MGESQYDHPFQWGSKRTGPDLAREGGKYPNLWHYRHLIDPREVTEGSNMPMYPGLVTANVDDTATAPKMRAMRSIGVPYTEQDIAGAQSDEHAQGSEIAKDLADNGATVDGRSEMVALIAYLQRLGVHAEPKPAPANVSMAP